MDKKLLENFLPYKTELDYWKDTCYISLVGFMFLDTSLMGFKIPFHTNFEEINLRFYVRHNERGQWKRGVVFIKEIVSKPALTLVANAVYGEPYQTMPTKHSWTINQDEITVEYHWKKKRWNAFKVIAANAPVLFKPESEEAFITEHYWGYTKRNAVKTSEYGVEHPTWEVYPVKSYEVDVDFKSVYGSEFEFLKSQTPLSVFLAEGSAVIVNKGTVLR